MSVSLTAMAAPLDTLMHAMPPPCHAGERIPGLDREADPAKWQQWWWMFNTGTLPREFPCCVCGHWFELHRVTECKRPLLDAKSQAVINTTLNEIYLCRQCKAACPECKSAITRFQREKFGACSACAGGSNGGGKVSSKGSSKVS